MPFTPFFFKRKLKCGTCGETEHMPLTGLYRSFQHNQAYENNTYFPNAKKTSEKILLDVGLSIATNLTPPGIFYKFTNIFMGGEYYCCECGRTRGGWFHDHPDPDE